MTSDTNGDNFAWTSQSGQFLVLYLRERLRGTLEDSIWAVHYQKRFWQAVINGGHSIPLTVLGAVLAWLGNCDALLAFSRARCFMRLGIPSHIAVVSYLRNRAVASAG